MCLEAQLVLERRNVAGLCRRRVQLGIQPIPRASCGCRNSQHLPEPEAWPWRAAQRPFPGSASAARPPPAAPGTGPGHGGGDGSGRATRLSGAAGVGAEEPPVRAAAAAAPNPAVPRPAAAAVGRGPTPRGGDGGGGGSALLQEIKALVVAHNIPSRLFARWDVAVTSPVTHPEDSTQSQSIEEVVAECLTLLVNVADYVLKSAEGDSSDSLHTLAPELLIPAETIGYLCKAEECSSPVDFLRMYLSPIQPALDSDPAQLHQIQAGNAPADGCAFMPALWASAAVLHCQPLPHVSPSSFISSSHPIISAPVLFPL
ncbi:testis-expressed protein 47 isoform X3 [Lagopus muta]|uniref:testis-expressed protein 47 isoform X3 n=1 Tax=Lagopus muta TaxID=64668 RepID=UPI00209F986B|nr:testis-expressed protein 47 isoform X3 [Lagopus muta]